MQLLSISTKTSEGGMEGMKQEPAGKALLHGRQATPEHC